MIPFWPKNKSGFALVAVIGVLGLIIMLQARTLHSVRNSLAQCNTARQYELEIFNSEREKAKAVIEEQNLSIQEFKLDEEAFQRRMFQREREITATQVVQQKEIAVELQKDASCENQLRIITETLRRFSNE